MFATLAIVFAAGLVGPLLNGGRRQLAPVVVGELLAGMALGRTGLGLVDVGSSPAFPVLYALGFAMLMLTAGTHVDIASPAIRSGAARGILALGIVGVAAAVLGFVLFQLVGRGSAPLFAVLLAGSSAAVAFPIIEENDLKGPSIAMLVAWIALADTVTIVLLPLTLTGGGAMVPALVGDGAIVVAALAAYFGARFVGRRVKVTQARERSWQRGWALELRLSLLLLLGLSVIADRTGASTLVAGFLAGMTLVRLHASNRLEIQLVGVANGFLVPIFFVLLGARINLRALAQDPAAIGVAVALAAGAVMVHVAAALVVGGERRLASGLAASAQLGLPAAAASIGLATHRLTPALAAALVAAGCLTLVPASLRGALLARDPGPDAKPRARRVSRRGSAS